MVYEAVRDDKEFERRVAIKLVQRNIASPAALDRLRAERQILANFDHPFIARLMDCGTSPEGLPYLVMELVEGRPVNQLVGGLNRDARLKLYLQICFRRRVRASKSCGSSGSKARKHFRVRPIRPSCWISESLSCWIRVQYRAIWLDAGLRESRTKAGVAGIGRIRRYSLGVLLRELIPAEWLDADLAAIVAKAVRGDPVERYESVDRLAEEIWTRFISKRTVLARQTSSIGWKIRQTAQAGVSDRGRIRGVRQPGARLRSPRPPLPPGASARWPNGWRNTGDYQPGGALAYPTAMSAVRKSVNERSVDLSNGCFRKRRAMRSAAGACHFYQRLALAQGTVFSANAGDRGAARATMEKALYLRERCSTRIARAPAESRSVRRNSRLFGTHGDFRRGARRGLPGSHAGEEAKPLVERGDWTNRFTSPPGSSTLLGIDLEGRDTHRTWAIRRAPSVFTRIRCGFWNGGPKRILATG